MAFNDPFGQVNGLFGFKLEIWNKKNRFILFCEIKLG